MAGKGARLWSTCARCHQHEWNDVFLPQNNQCSKCRCSVKVYKPKQKGVDQVDSSNANQFYI
eukprot:6997636-Pyramimonas_sp.AAC.1